MDRKKSSDDGIALGSMSHPEIDPSSLVDSMIEISDDSIILQAFVAQGRRVLPHDSTSHECWLAATEMVNNFGAWLLGVKCAVKKFRLPPEINWEQDFVSGAITVQFYARGFLQKPVKIKDHKTIMVEL